MNLLSPAAHESTSESPPREDFNHDVQKHHLPIVHVPEDFPCESDSLELRLLNTEQLQFTPVVSFPSSSLQSQNSSIEFDHGRMDTIQTGRVTPPLLQTASESGYFCIHAVHSAIIVCSICIFLPCLLLQSMFLRVLPKPVLFWETSTPSPSPTRVVPSLSILLDHVEVNNKWSVVLRWRLHVVLWAVVSL